MYGLVKCVVLLYAAVAASAFNLGSMDVVFHLYTRANPTISQPLLPSINSIMTSSFSLARPTIFTIHNNGESVAGNFNAFVVPAHIAAADVNVIAVDWSPGSSFYTEGLSNAPQCGQVIADFANILITQFNYNPSLIRIVGVGLGGHIAGIAARNINGEVPHIVALDPSLHGWTHHPDILNRDDAGVVEVLHVTAGSLGYDYPLGDIDFYPNGGGAQTGCITTACSHTYGYAFYAESIIRVLDDGNSFTGTNCDNYEDARAMRCSGPRDVDFGGNDVKEDGTEGIYVFLTNSQSPFARG